MGIKTVPHRPYSPDIAPCDFWLFPKLRGCRYEVMSKNWGDERGCDEGHWHAQIRGLPWGLPEVFETAQQVNCSRRRLLRRGLYFYKGAHTKKVRKLIVYTSFSSSLMSFLMLWWSHFHYVHHVQWNRFIQLGCLLLEVLFNSVNKSSQYT